MIDCPVSDFGPAEDQRGNESGLHLVFVRYTKLVLVGRQKYVSILRQVLYCKQALKDDMADRSS